MPLKNIQAPAVNILRKVAICVLPLFFLFGIVQPAFSLSKILLNGRLFDFNFTYMRAVEAFLSGINMYSFGDINYPPPALFLFLPFSFVPVFYSQIIFTFLSIVCLIISVILIIKGLGWRMSKEETLVLIPLIFLSFPVKWTFGMGQINNLILLLIVLSFYFFQKKKDLFSGISLGLAIALKIVPGFLLIFFLIRKKFWVVLSSAITTAVCFFLSGLFFGFDLIFEYFFKVLPAIAFQPNKDIYYNQAFSGFVDRVGLNQIFVWIFLITVLVITFYSFIKKTKDNSIGFSLILSATLLINTFSWQHHFVWLVFPFLSAFYYLKTQKAFLVKVLLFASYVLVALNIKQPDLLIGSFLGNIALSHVFLGNFLLWLILLYISWYHIADE